MKNRKKKDLIRIHSFSFTGSHLPSGLLTEAFCILVRRQVPWAEFTHSNHHSTFGNLQTQPLTLICFSIIVSGMKNKTTAEGKEKPKSRQLLSSPAAFCWTPPPSTLGATSRCELHRFLVLMLRHCAWRKVLWSGTDLYQSMQMLDVGAGAGGAPPLAPQTVTLAGREWNESSDLYWTHHSSSLFQVQTEVQPRWIAVWSERDWPLKGTYSG